MHQAASPARRALAVVVLAFVAGLFALSVRGASAAGPPVRTWTWEQLPRMPVSASGPAVTLGRDGRVYAFGGGYPALVRGATEDNLRITQVWDAWW